MILGLLKKICMVQDVNGDRIQGRYGLSGDLIRRPYSTIHDRREELVDDRIRESLEVMVWPTYDLSETSDDRIEYGGDLRRMRKRCGFDCARLQVPFPIDELSQHIAANLIRAAFHAFSYPNNSRHVFKEEISAVSIYIASHLISRLISRRAILGVMGEGWYPDIGSTCRVVRNACNQLVSEGFRETLDVELSWETLEADVSEEIDDENDDLMEGDRSRGQGETTRDEVTSGVSASKSRREQLVGLCKCRAVYKTEVMKVIFTSLKHIHCYQHSAGPGPQNLNAISRLTQDCQNESRKLKVPPYTLIGAKRGEVYRHYRTRWNSGPRNTCWLSCSKWRDYRPYYTQPSAGIPCSA